MITANVDMTRFNSGIRGLIQKVRLNSRVVVAKEAGELIKTLVRVSPPSDRSKTKANIEKDIRGKFESANDSSFSTQSRYTGKVGASGILWYRVDSLFLRGIAPEMDKRSASVDELAKLRFSITKKGRRNLSFLAPRKIQRVLLYQTLLTKASTVKDVALKAVKNMGRLKAAWLVSVFRGPIRISGANMPPAWVTRHADGARGSFVDALGAGEFPKFTIINSASGIGQKKVNYLVGLAVQIRSKAMAANALLFMRGKKNLSDYAK